MSADQPERFTLDVPGTARNVSTARAFAASVARRFDLDEQAVEDVKLAVSESLNTCLGARESRSHNPLRLMIEWNEGRLRVDIHDPEGRGELRSTRGGWGEDVIRALFEDARIQTDGRGTGVTFSLEARVST